MRLQIFQKEYLDEPFLTLDQDDYGIAVAGGDARMVDALKLNQFKDLKEIADYLNSDPSGQYQAQFDGEEPKDQSTNSEALDDRMKPALKVLRELMSRVKNRKDQEVAEEDAKKPEAQALASTDSQIVANPSEMLYVSYDGDNIGNAVARAERTDNEQQLMAISNKINEGQRLFLSWAQQNGGQVIEQGGDEGLCKVPGAAKDRIEEFRAQYANLVGATCSIGVGKKISEATDARMLAKLKGKDRTEQFDDSTRKELDLRLEEKGDAESTKIRESLQGHSQTEQPQDVKAPQPEAAQQAPAPEQAEDPTQEQPEQQGPDQAASQQYSPELIDEMRNQLSKSDEQEPESVFASPMHDPQIEQADYSYSDDPDFSKSLRYAAKYGDRK